VNSALADKVMGCLAASQVASAMGAAVEGWSWRRIRQEHGVLDRMLPYEHYGNGWQRMAGTTEDGIERQRVFLRAIRRAGGRIGPEHVAAVWAEEVDPEQADWCMEPFDRRLIRLARLGLPAVSLGSANPYTDLCSLARSCHPLGLINAMDPEQAWRDVHHVGLVLQQPLGSGLDWAGLVGAVLAVACRPGATFDSALDAGLALAGDRIAREVSRALEVAEAAAAPLDMCEEFDDIYFDRSVPYAFSQANEVVSKAMAVVRACHADPRACIVTGVSFGRDTDCLAATAGGIAGALNGASALPAEWIEQLDAATEANPHTCLRMPVAEMAGMVIDALQAEAGSAGSRSDAVSEALRPIE